MKAFRTGFQAFLVALEMLRLHKLRAFLTMLGVIIGVMAVTFIVMIGNGFKAYLGNQFNALGADTIYVVFDPGRRARREGRGTLEGLRMTDVEYLRERVPQLDIVSPMMQTGSPRVQFGDREFENPTVVGVDENYAPLIGTEVEDGRLISRIDQSARTNVAAIGTDIRDKLFPDKKWEGKYITMSGITVQVIGIMKPKDVMGSSTKRQIWMPLSTMQDKWTGAKNLTLIATRPDPGVKVKDAMDRVWEAMMIKSGNRQVYRVDSNESILGVLNGVLGAASALLAAIAALSLLVGGIGIMNIMLVSVTERTREIGLRKAVGARSGNIMTQFLVESGTLGLVGGLIGMAIAWGLGSLVTVLTVVNKWPQEGGLPTPFPLTAALGSAVFSALIGMVFGLYPALSAAKLDPIVALRRE
jgi:putative ABC transport system permease protein